MQYHSADQFNTICMSHNSEAVGGGWRGGVGGGNYALVVGTCLDFLIKAIA
jgi:hypothetical protein